MQSKSRNPTIFSRIRGKEEEEKKKEEEHPREEPTKNRKDDQDNEEVKVWNCSRGIEERERSIPRMDKNNMM